MLDLKQALRGRVVLAGVGVVGRGDDGFGPLLARRLEGASNLHVFDCGDRLEDYTGDIAGENPDTILIADAVDMGLSAGTLALLEADDILDGMGDTHNASLEVTMNYLRERTGANVFLCGVQPALIADRETLSPEVSSGLAHLSNLLKSWSEERDSRQPPNQKESANEP